MTALQIVGAGGGGAGGHRGRVHGRGRCARRWCWGSTGIALTFLFFTFQAPDVALSEIVVTSVGLPIIVLAALRKIRQQEDQRGREERDELSRRVRLGLFLVAGSGLLAVLVIGFTGLPAFGHAHELYGRWSTGPSRRSATRPTSSPH